MLVIVFMFLMLVKDVFVMFIWYIIFVVSFWCFGFNSDFFLVVVRMLIFSGFVRNSLYLVCVVLFFFICLVGMIFVIVRLKIGFGVLMEWLLVSVIFVWWYV